MSLAGIIFLTIVGLALLMIVGFIILLILHNTKWGNRLLCAVGLHNYEHTLNFPTNTSTSKCMREKCNKKVVIKEAMDMGALFNSVWDKENWK